jgi:hypothetical protein
MKKQAMTKKQKPKPVSPFDWLAGDNKPDALGYIAIDRVRWEAFVKMVKGASSVKK